MKHSRLIIIITAVILLMVTRADAALSLEARAAIEEMRARVAQNIQGVPSDESDEGRYIPGKELKSVLARYRSTIYGSPDATDSTLAHWRVSVSDQATTATTEYQAGALLEKALVNYRTQRKVFSLVKTMKAREASARDDQDSDQPVATASGADENKNLPDQSTDSHANASVSVSSSELLTQSKEALQESVESPKPLSEQTSVSQAKPDASVETVSDEADKDAEVQKYEFKMPRNYRIMVK